MVRQIIAIRHPNGKVTLYAQSSETHKWSAIPMIRSGSPDANKIVSQASEITVTDSFGKTVELPDAERNLIG